MDNNYQDMEALNIANRRNKVIENYNKGLEKSITKPKLTYKERKKQAVEKVKKAIVTTVLIGTALSVAIGYNVGIVKASSTDFNLPGIETEYEKNIDDKINGYIKAMDMYADKKTSIETSYGRNQDNTDVNVDYTEQNIDNLADHFINAGNVSEIELRCAILAAYNVINEPYRESVINRGIIRAREKEQEDPLLNTVNPLLGNNIEQMLHNLGHDNIQDYHKNERNDIKELTTLSYEQYKNK